MKILIIVPDTLPQAVIQQRIKELEDSLKKEALLPEKKISKWQQMVQRIESQAFDLGGYTDTFNQGRDEFRKSFTFKE